MSQAEDEIIATKKYSVDVEWKDKSDSTFAVKDLKFEGGFLVLWTFDEETVIQAYPARTIESVYVYPVEEE